jgi:hypothetical protein
MTRLTLALAGLVGCSGAWAEAIYLDCKTKNHDLMEQGGYDRMYVIDTGMQSASVHYDYGFMATGTARVTAGSFQISFYEVPKVEISRVSGKYLTEFDGSADSGECQSVDNPNLKF